MWTWFWIGMTATQTVLAGLRWREWLDFLDLRNQYSPEVLAAAHFHIPPGLIWNATGSSILAVIMWVRAFFMVRNEDRNA